MSSSSSSSSSSAARVSPLPHGENLMDRAKGIAAALVIAAVNEAYSIDVSDLQAEIVAKMTRPPDPLSMGDLAVPIFVFIKRLPAPTESAAAPEAEASNEGGKKKKEKKPAGVNPAEAASKIAAVLLQKKHEDVDKIEVKGTYFNFFMSAHFIASIVPAILTGSFLYPRSSTGKDRVMIEYSQPNTHKAFHVGHMRNAALGDSLVRLYEYYGYPVVAANYFGDEGAHVAKCLWHLKKFLSENPSFQLDSVPETERGEWLGDHYTQSVEVLDLETYTKYPFPSVLAAKVLTISPHPAADAPSNWRVVTLDIGAASPTTVVCGGVGYKVADVVAYMPVGAKMSVGEGKKTVEVAVKDMKGVASAGVMLAKRELGLEEEEEKKEEEKKEEKKKEEKEAGKKEKGGKGGKKEEKKDTESDSSSNQIFLVDPSIAAGRNLIEAGRRTVDQFGKPLKMPIPAGVPLVQELKHRKEEVKETLRKMESGDSELCSLWDKTKDWSLTEFHRIYHWLDSRFDVEFSEHQVADESKEMVLKYQQEKPQVVIESNGAVGIDLHNFSLGFCMLLKSDGSGLYATKDLALAVRKFRNYHIDRSIYIVDAAQSLHFKQVFKSLELLGWSQAEKCFHLSYGTVVLPSGKMSSRKGNVILFSELKKKLEDSIFDQYLRQKQEGYVEEETAEDGGKTFKKMQKNEAVWTNEEIARAKHLQCVATIKYGMLNHDTAKDIVFKLDDWTASTGNTGCYMLYQYTRCRSIQREILSATPNLLSSVIADYSLLTHPAERAALLKLHDFWNVVSQTLESKNPATLCNYLFDLSKAFSQFYARDECSVMKAKTEQLKVTRMNFVASAAEVIKQGLALLGIRVLERM